MECGAVELVATTTSKVEPPTSDEVVAINQQPKKPQVSTTTLQSIGSLDLFENPVLFSYLEMKGKKEEPAVGLSSSSETTGGSVEQHGTVYERGGCMMCEGELRLLVWKKKVSVRTPSGTFTQRSRNMKTWRCHLCSWVKPVNLDLGSQPSTSEGGGALGSSSNVVLGPLGISNNLGQV